jgi:hypothetical protein
MTKSQAQEQFAEFLKPLAADLSPDVTLESFVEDAYLPFYRRKWKPSTLMTNEHRIQHHIVSEFGSRELRTFTRDELQSFLDSKSSVVQHGRSLTLGFSANLRNGDCGRNR